VVRGPGDRLAAGRGQPHRRLDRGGAHPMTMDVTSPGVSDRLAEGVVMDAAHVDVSYNVRGTDRLAVRDVSFQIGRSESFGLVGESGSRQTQIALPIPPSPP